MQHWLSSCGSQLSCLTACEIFIPGPGTEPLSPALASRFLTSGPPGKFHDGKFFLLCILPQKIHKTQKTKCCPSSGPRKEMTGLSFLRVFLLLTWELWSPLSVTPSLAYALNLWCGDVSGDHEHRAPAILLGVGLHGQDPSSLHL